MPKKIKGKIEVHFDVFIDNCKIINKTVKELEKNHNIKIRLKKWHSEVFCCVTEFKPRPNYRFIGNEQIIIRGPAKAVYELLI